MISNARFILSKSKLINEYNLLRSNFDQVSYSFKTNIVVGKILEYDTDSFFSVHSENLLSQLSEVSRVWFFIQSQSKSQIDDLVNVGVTKFIIDNVKDYETLVLSLSGFSKKFDVLLRSRLKENTIHTGKFFVFGLFSAKLNEFIEDLDSKDYINSVGVHFHRKTQNVSEWSLIDDFKNIISADNLKKISFVNIGGGIPVIYKNSRPNLKFIFKKIKEFKDYLYEHNVKIIVEPGRFLSATCIDLETNIINIYDGNLVIDASVYNAAMDTFIANTRLEVIDESLSGFKYCIKGMTPDSVDIFRYRVYFDIERKVGDKLIFKNAGAYNFACNFLGLEQLKTDIID